MTWITMTRKSGKHCAQHTEPLDRCFDQCMPDFLDMVMQFMILEFYLSSLIETYIFVASSEVLVKKRNILEKKK